MPNVPRVSLKSISKAFGDVQALETVSLNVQKGHIHALVGENGAGKTTLMNVLYGALKSDSGTIEIDGQEAVFHSSKDALAKGIGMVSQHYGIIPGLTCLQNLILGSEPGLYIDRKRAAERAEKLAQDMNFSFDWKADAVTLSPGSAQKLEIMKLLWKQADIMILDEPTAMLSPADGDALFQSLRQLTSEGSTVILVTHRIPEVLNFCQEVTVLRGGRLIEERPVEGLDKETLAAMIVGEALPKAEREQIRPPADAPVILKAENMTVKGDRGDEALKSVSLELRAGEMVGLAGVDGSGQRELFEAVVGIRPVAAGMLELFGEKAGDLTPNERIHEGLRLIAEDRYRDAMIAPWSLEWNSVLGIHDLEPLARKGWISRTERAKAAAAIADRFHTKHGGLSLPIESLSGGNQQRFIGARALMLAPRLILAFQPARGLDLKATAEIYQGLRQAAADGAAVLVVSFDLDELLEHCDRMVAAFGGKISGPKDPYSLDRAEIGRLMVGAAQ